MRLFALLALGLAAATPLHAKLSPMHADKFLVAGSSDKGFRDGEFWRAAFDRPQGLALSGDGDDLYVGDLGNRAIRVVSLKLNTVSTRWRSTGSAAVPMDALDMAVLGKDLFFVPSDGKGLWRLPEGSASPVLLAGSSLTAGTVSGPIVVSPWAAVLWLDLAGPGGARLMAYTAAGLTHSASAAIAGLSPGDGSRLTALDGLTYVIRRSQLERIDLEGGLPRVFLYGVTVSPATLALLPVSLAGMDWPFPIDGRGCFTGWEARTSGMLMAYPQGATVTVALEDQVGGRMSDINVGPDRGASLVRQYPWLHTGGRAVYDPTRRKAYFADTHNRHIVGWTWTAPHTDPERWVNYYIGPSSSEPKDPEIQRLLVISNSLFVGIADHSPVNNIRKSMWKQFELHLNILHALAGTGRRYTVGVKGASVGITKGVCSYAVNNMDEFVKLGTDDLLITVEPKALVSEMLYLLEGPQTDDLLAPEVDPEWVTSSVAEQEAGWGPLTREMVSLFEKDKAFFHELIRRDANGRMSPLTNEPARYFSNAKFSRLALKFQDKMMAKLEKAAKGRPFKVRFLIMPFSNAGNPGDIQGGTVLGDLPPDFDLNVAFTALARSHGFGCVDMVPSFRVLGPTLMPFYFDGDHYIAQGHLWLGQIAAKLYFDELRAEAKK